MKMYEIAVTVSVKPAGSYKSEEIRSEKLSLESIDLQAIAQSAEACGSGTATMLKSIWRRLSHEEAAERPQERAKTEESK